MAGYGLRRFEAFAACPGRRLARAPRCVAAIFAVKPADLHPGDGPLALRPEIFPAAMLDDGSGETRVLTGIVARALTLPFKVDLRLDALDGGRDRLRGVNPEWVYPEAIQRRRNLDTWQMPASMMRHAVMMTRLSSPPAARIANISIAPFLRETAYDLRSPGDKAKRRVSRSWGFPQLSSAKTSSGHPEGPRNGS